MGMAAASALPEARVAKTSAERGQGTMVAPGTSLRAASWLKEPGSPWIAIFMRLLSLSEMGCSTAAPFRTIPYAHPQFAGMGGASVRAVSA